MFEAHLGYIALWQDPISKQTNKSSINRKQQKFLFASKTKCSFTCADLKAGTFVS